MRKRKLKYYRVVAEFGHQGAGRYTTITLYIEAKDLVDAIDKAKKFPGVKHDKPNCIRAVDSISKEEYIESRQSSAYERFKK